MRGPVAKADENTKVVHGARDLPNSQSKFLFYFLNCKMFLEEFAA